MWLSLMEREKLNPYVRTHRYTQYASHKAQAEKLIMIIGKKV